MSAPNPHDMIRMASFSLPPGMHCACGANVLRWTDRTEGRATCNGCGEQWVLTGRGGCIEAMGIDPNAWHEAHELAALERLFEIGLHGMKAFGSSAMTKAVRLAARATSTQDEFESALRNVMLFSPLSIRTEVAHVRRMVAERLAP